MTVSFNSSLRYCPACGADAFRPHGEKSLRCQHCDFVLYFNAAAAVAALIEHEDCLLLTVRRFEPGAGLLDLPGGFVDHGETVEAALIRELQEELGLDVPTVWGDRSPLSSCYVGSFPNTYPYKGVVYATVDMFYHLRLTERPVLVAKDDVAATVWIPWDEIYPEKIAFSSARCVIQRLLDKRRSV